MDQNIKTLVWIFGRGLSISCGLRWTVPASLNAKPRDIVIEEIKKQLTIEMDKDVNTEKIQFFLSELKERTTPCWKNLFATTNWDYLLQREVLKLNLDALPNWLSNSHVFHLNGTIEPRRDQNFSSTFLLESDSFQERKITPESNRIFNGILWSRVFVIVGMSFECESDRFFLHSIKLEEDNLPIGESVWIVINPDRLSLEKSVTRIRSSLPRAAVIPLLTTFDNWTESGMKELSQLNILK
ncbi:hypothetical protein [Cellvibrio zantedeschiae]|uniref:hypothetical protein n=1 Tax=Cellvibrio zantedeschiae TaxID=1237077 RepID=UPI0016734611|nr:hypothetical protein [Cellvibrio zantedeschiae]